MELFALYLGGRGERSLIELHDVVICAAENLDEACAIAKKRWWGLPQYVHIDSHIALTYVDGYKITLIEEPIEEPKKLFFLHFGGYEPHRFGEVHRSLFLVGESQAEVVKKARLSEEHLDDCIAIDSIDGYYLHFLSCI